MTGVEFLERSIEFAPAARRTLLTAYADTEAAIRAINSAKIHYYLTKPWDPPEERLYPVLNDLLETWKEGYKPPFEGVRVVGPRYTLRDHQALAAGQVRPSVDAVQIPEVVQPRIVGIVDIADDHTVTVRGVVKIVLGQGLSSTSAKIRSAATRRVSRSPTPKVSSRCVSHS